MQREVWPDGAVAEREGGGDEGRGGERRLRARAGEQQRRSPQSYRRHAGSGVPPKRTSASEGIALTSRSVTDVVRTFSV